ncbi:ribonuclease H-like domain-containing protein [Gigaspora rosea]|uniref:Ribonuclease H-like domain-containing protein n=1 Tax=Gigaspora rosea TaxID=44941 RepID=A0A397VWV3_9GLOM|nr:ribonuclease H-like domain-containing protein [Gigaspora rosea]
MDLKILILLIFTLFFVLSVTSITTIAPVATITHQVYPTLPPSCSSSKFTLIKSILSKAYVRNKKKINLSCNVQDPEDEDKYIALDCEFLHIGPPGQLLVKTEVVQVAIVDYNGTILLNEYVRPDEPRIYWRTPRDYLYVNGSSPAVMRSKVHEIVKDKIIVGFNMYNDLTGLRIYHSPNMLRDIELCHRYKVRPKQTMSLKAAVQMDLNRTIQRGSHDALEDALATMELFRINRDFWDEMIPKRGLTSTSEPTLAPFPPAPPACLPPTNNYVAMSISSAVLRSGRKREYFPLHIMLVDYSYVIVLDEYIRQNITDLQTNVTGVERDIECQRLRDLQRSPPIRFNPDYRNKLPSF